jgi:hypothetical protein
MSQLNKIAHIHREYLPRFFSMFFEWDVKTVKNMHLLTMHVIKPIWYNYPLLLFYEDPRQVGER